MRRETRWNDEDVCERRNDGRWVEKDLGRRSGENHTRLGSMKKKEKRRTNKNPTKRKKPKKNQKKKIQAIASKEEVKIMKY